MPGSVGLSAKIALALLERLPGGVALFASDGGLMYANGAARRWMEACGEPVPEPSRELFERLGATLSPLWVDGACVGDVAYLRVGGPAGTLAELERSAILETLGATGWRLRDSARRLGISRTTLWRRLKRYGLLPRQRR